MYTHAQPGPEHVPGWPRDVLVSPYGTRNSWGAAAMKYPEKTRSCSITGPHVHEHNGTATNAVITPRDPWSQYTTDDWGTTKPGFRWPCGEKVEGALDVLDWWTNWTRSVHW